MTKPKPYGIPDGTQGVVSSTTSGPVAIPRPAAIPPNAARTPEPTLPALVDTLIELTRLQNKTLEQIRCNQIDQETLLEQIVTVLHSLVKTLAKEPDEPPSYDPAARRRRLFGGDGSLT